MRLKLLVLTLATIGMLASASSAIAGSWSTYFGPGIVYQSNYVHYSGSWYWTNNRVYRPIGHPFQLAYWPSGGNLHWSVNNSSDNPFYFPSYGYNNSACAWAYWQDLSGSVSPVTCQVYG